MVRLTKEQIAHFTYWVWEERLSNSRGIDDQPSPKKRLEFIENDLIDQFLEKYPEGILTGWNTAIFDP